MFPCPAGCAFSLGRKSSSSNGSSRRVLCLIVQTMVQKLVKNYCFSRVSEGTLGTFQVRSGAVPSFRATVFPCPAGCVCSLGRKSSSSNGSSRRVLCLIVQTVVQKLVENTGRSGRNSVAATRTTTTTPTPTPTATATATAATATAARFWRCSVLQGHCVSLSGRVRFQSREEEQQ